ncbi:MAG TPA: hypothetical protein VMM35_12600 [Longimicrobiales bacterium]|nr:hypothetical protein [Longimicrobiales bacterium]
MGSCCGNPPWYHHFELYDLWTAGGRPLGHLLGGHGTEWRAYVRGSGTDTRFRLEVDAFRRQRGAENLFAPERIGRSHRGIAGATWAATRRGRTELRLDLEYERGDGWSALRWAFGVRKRL